MPLNLEAFRSVANSATITSRDIEIQRTGKDATVALDGTVTSTPLTIEPPPQPANA